MTAPTKTAEDAFSPLLLGDALAEMYCHGYQAYRVSSKFMRDGGDASAVYYTIPLHNIKPRLLRFVSNAGTLSTRRGGMYASVPDYQFGPVDHADSRHVFNTALPTLAQTPQTEVKWAFKHGADMIEFFCSPLHVDDAVSLDDDDDDDDDDVIGGFVHDPTVYIRYFNGHYAVFFSTCTPMGPRFWSRLFARGAAVPWFSAAVPLDVRQQLISYQFLIHTLAASVLQGFMRGIGWRILFRRAQRRRLLKLALLRPDAAADVAELVWRLKATPKVIWTKVLTYI
jgi:hypothetical protein